MKWHSDEQKYSQLVGLRDDGCLRSVHGGRPSSPREPRPASGGRSKSRTSSFQEPSRLADGGGSGEKSSTEGADGQRASVYKTFDADSSIRERRFLGQDQSSWAYDAFSPFPVVGVAPRRFAHPARAPQIMTGPRDRWTCAACELGVATTTDRREWAPSSCGRGPQRCGWPTKWALYIVPLELAQCGVRGNCPQPV